MRRNDNTGIIEFDFDDAEDWKEAYAELLDTETGQRYLTECEVSDKDPGRILRAAMTLFHLDEENSWGTVEQLQTALSKLMLSGKIKPVETETVAALPVPTAPVAETPRLTGSQQAWHEYRVWSDSHSSSECRLRARSDEGYGNFFRKNLEREFGAQQVGDAVIPAGQSSGRQAPTQELRDFARSYLTERSENLRPKSGLITLAGRQLSYAYLNEMVEKCSQAGLL